MKPLPVYMNAKHQKLSTKIFQKFLTFQLIGLILAEPSLKKVLVTDGRNKGKCLDGSPPGYYKKEFDPDVTIENKVLIELPAGAWCYWLETTHENEKGDGAHCSNRSNGSKGSSLNQYNKANKTINRYGMASESSDFNRWEYYEFIYCDGFSWQGRREEPLKTRDEKDLHFRGYYSFLDLIENIFRDRKKPEQVILKGNSAGGLATMHFTAFEILRK